jgi:hypothetical protein
MKTSNFKLYSGDKGIAICIRPPIDWSGANFPALEPRRQDFYALKDGKMTEAEYEKNYREYVLAHLDPREIYEKLKDTVLLCWEDPKWEKGRTSGDFFCHRRIVAKWIQEKLNIMVPEWDPSDEKIETKALF